MKACSGVGDSGGEGVSLVVVVGGGGVGLVVWMMPLPIRYMWWM